MGRAQGVVRGAAPPCATRERERGRDEEERNGLSVGGGKRSSASVRPSVRPRQVALA